MLVAQRGAYIEAPRTLGRGDTGRRASVDGHLEVDSVEKFEPPTPLDGSEDERRRKEQFQGPLTLW